MPNEILFIDRDGTLIEERHYLHDPDQVRLVDGALEAVVKLNRASVPVVLVTNQSGVARGMFTEHDVEAVHARLTMLLEQGGATLDALFYCPHLPQAEVRQYRKRCPCRKPNPGMLLAGLRRFGIEPKRAWIVGDKLDDIQAAHRIGGRGILVRTGYGREAEREAVAAGVRPFEVTDDFPTAVDWWLDNRHQSNAP